MESEETQAIRMVRERRVGRFLVPHELVMTRPTDVVELLRDKIVIRCEMLAFYNTLKYIAYGSYFAPVPEGGIAPLYDLLIERDCLGFVHPPLAAAEKAMLERDPQLPMGITGAEKIGGTLMGRAFLAGAANKPPTAMEMLRKEELEAGSDFAYAAGSRSADVGQKAERWRTPVDDRNGGRR